MRSRTSQIARPSDPAGACPRNLVIRGAMTSGCPGFSASVQPVRECGHSFRNTSVGREHRAAFLQQANERSSTFGSRWHEQIAPLPRSAEPLQSVA